MEVRGVFSSPNLRTVASSLFTVIALSAITRLPGRSSVPDHQEPYGETKNQNALRFDGEASVHRADVCPVCSTAARRQRLVYEVKFDGYRCLAGRDSTGVTLWSRRGRALRCRQIQSLFLSPHTLSQFVNETASRPVAGDRRASSVPMRL